MQNDLGPLTIDYLQLMSGSGRRSDNRQQEISDISRALKALARERYDLYQSNVDAFNN